MPRREQSQSESETARMPTASTIARHRSALVSACAVLLLGLAPTLVTPVDRVSAANLPAPATAPRSARFT